jgi:hypothetical protein
LGERGVILCGHHPSSISTVFHVSPKKKNFEFSCQKRKRGFISPLPLPLTSLSKSGDVVVDDAHQTPTRSDREPPTGHNPQAPSTPAPQGSALRRPPNPHRQPDHPDPSSWLPSNSEGDEPDPTTQSHHRGFPRTVRATKSFSARRSRCSPASFCSFGVFQVRF